MDKVKLTPEQLKELKRFIISRGFREPLVVMEILDHFACKVEEKQEAQPELNLQQAMTAAHNDFGIMGFRHIAASADIQRYHKYKNYCKAHFTAIVKKPLYMVLLALGGYLYYLAYTWAAMHSSVHIWGDNPVAWGLLLVFCTGALSAKAQLPKGYSARNYNNYYSFSNMGWWAVVVMFTAPRSTVFHVPLWIPALYCSIVFVYLVVHFIVLTMAASKMFEDYAAIEQLMPELE